MIWCSSTLVRFSIGEAEKLHLEIWACGLTYGTSSERKLKCCIILSVELYLNWGLLTLIFPPLIPYFYHYVCT